MKVLIIGPAGSGKSFVSAAWKHMNIPAFDADELPQLSAWYNKQGKKVPEPASPEEAIGSQYAYLWSRRYLESFLARHQDVYLFGGSGNIFSMLDLFDRVFFLHIENELQKQRLQSAGRPRPHLDHDKNGNPVVWGQWFEEASHKHGLSFINANQTPEQIYDALKKHL